MVKAESNEKEVLDLKNIRKEQGFNFQAKKKAKPKPRQNDEMELDIEEEEPVPMPVMDDSNIQPPQPQFITEREQRNINLFAVLEKVGAANQALVEAQAILFEHECYEPAQNVSDIINYNMRQLENNLQKLIVENCDQPEVRERPRPSVPRAVEPKPPAAAVDADAALALALQAEEQEKNDLRLAQSLQEREQHILQREHRRQQREARQRQQQMEFQARNMEMQARNMNMNHQINHQHLMNGFNLNFPNIQFDFDDSDFDIQFSRNNALLNQLRSMDRFDGDLDDLMRALEMQDRGANAEEIAQFSNEEQFHRRNCSNANKDDDSAEHDEQCCICMEKFVEGDKIRRLPCLHIFHTHEIDQWLQQNRTCPICKTDIQQAG